MSEPFIDYLEKLRDRKDNGALAKLRRGLGKETGDVEMYPYVMPFLPKNGFGGETYFLVASLFALHPDPPSSRGISMGTVFKKIGDNDSIEKRFKSLLDTHEDNLGYHLRQAISLAKSKNVTVDYHQLFRDLKNWTHPDRFVQLNWGRDFWASYSNEKSDKK